MKTLRTIKPYSDSVLEWDESLQKYVITIQYFKDNFDNVYADDEVLKRRLKSNTKLVYRWISNHINSANKRFVDKLLSCTQEGRDFIKEILTVQIEADAETGYNDLSKAPAVNLANGQIIPREELLRNQICVDAEQVFDDSNSYFGFRIGYQAPFPPYYFLFIK